VGANGAEIIIELAKDILMQGQRINKGHSGAMV